MRGSCVWSPSVLIVLTLFSVGPAHAQLPSPPVKTVTDTYAAKFICGVHPDTGINDMPDAQPGRYSTKINVHNNTGTVIRYRKKVIRLKGGEVATDPAEVNPSEALKSDQAMEVVCRDIYALLNIPLSSQSPPGYIEGFVIIQVYYQGQLQTNRPADPLDVVGVYTYRADTLPSPGGVSTGAGANIDVVVYPVKRNRHTIP